MRPISIICLCLAACAAPATVVSSLDEMIPPIEGLRASELHDTFDEVHNGHPHEAVDIMEPRGTPVHAVVSGMIVKLFLSKPGGNTIYEFDSSGTYCYYYAHLDRYALNVREGARVERGAIIGYVGFTGNAKAQAPHLHFEIKKLGQEKEWWKGSPLNPFQPLVDAVRRSQAR